ncbi:hypothetical protein [Streptomyces sp. NPDC049040]|uniref:hypothetical protein n=1 Tax=Streptomyces sp. NPDC049040 TaxID=3365593 RepID=UPI0037140E78
MREYEEVGHERAVAGVRGPDLLTRQHASSLPPAWVRGIPGGSLDSARAVLSMQRTAGNAAVATWLSAAGRTGGRRLDAHVQRDEDIATAEASQSDQADGDQVSGDAGMTPDVFHWMFDPDTLAQEIANIGDSDLGAADLVPDTPWTGADDDSLPTAQALSLQRDPPAGTDPGLRLTKPGSAGDVLKALSQLSQVRQGLLQIKQMALTDWKKLVGDPVALSISLSVSGMIAAGAIGGIESSPGTRRTVNPFLFGKDIPLPVPDVLGGAKLPGLSFKVLGAGAEANGFVLTLDFGKVLGWKAPSGFAQGDIGGGPR